MWKEFLKRERHEQNESIYLLSKNPKNFNNNLSVY